MESQQISKRRSREKTIVGIVTAWVRGTSLKFHNVIDRQKFAVIACVMVIGAAQARDCGFKLTGHFSSAIADSNGTWSVQQRLSITVSARDQQWQIQTDYGGGLVDYYGCNGTNVFRVLDDHRAPLNSLPGIVEADDYPADATPCVTVPWLAFCSAGRLDNKVPIPVPWTMARTSPSAYLYRWEVERSSTMPKLPSHIKFLTDPDKEKLAAKGTYLIREGLDNPARQLRSEDYVLLGGRDRVGADYTVLAKTNLSGLEIPTDIQLIYFDHLGPNKTGKPKLKYEILLDSISPLPETAELLPPISKPVDVVDYRLRDEAVPLDFALYRVSNGSWPVTITPEMRQALKRRRDEETSFLKIIGRAGVGKSLLIVMAGICLILPPVILITARRRN